MKAEVIRRLMTYPALLVGTLLCGLLSRSELVPLPVFVSTYAGDTLWALTVFWCVCILMPHWKTWKIALSAILFSFVIEFSQLYDAPWIDNVRHNRLGGLVLGFGFKTSDLVCYLVGILVGTFIVRLFLHSNRKTKSRAGKVH
jgi:hypothetical protein